MVLDSPRQPEEQPAPGTALEPLNDQDPAASPVGTDGAAATETTPDEDASTEPIAGRAGRRETSKRGGPLAFLRELPALLLIAFILALLIKSFLIQAFYIPSESMVPTLQVGDRVLVNKLVYRIHPPRRGDIIVFIEDPGPKKAFWGRVRSFLTEGLGVTKPKTLDFIKLAI